MRYVSIDIETTGLDPDQDQVLEFAAVVDDLDQWADRRIDQLPWFHRTMRLDRITGHPQALRMNAGLIARIADESDVMCGPKYLFTQYYGWLRGVVGRGPVPLLTPAGKNFNGFDRQFLNKLGFRPVFHYRSIDPGSMFLNRTAANPDSPVPSLQDIGRLLGIEWPEHTALGDARAVVYAVRAGLNRGRLDW